MDIQMKSSYIVNCTWEFLSECGTVQENTILLQTKNILHKTGGTREGGGCYIILFKFRKKNIAPK